MAPLILRFGRNAFWSGLAAILSGLAVPELLSICGSPEQMSIIVFFFVFCACTLAGNDQDILCGIILIPVLTQFLHLFERYDFLLGANSVWRLFPFLMIAIAVIGTLLIRPAAIGTDLRFLLIIWTIYHLFFLTITPQPGQLIGAGILIQIILPTTVCLFFNSLWKTEHYERLEQTLCLAFFMLAIGTVGLVLAGAAYKESVNLLVTRNIADTNVTMAYFILLWPFVMIVSRKINAPGVLVCGVILFLVILTISFSRGAIALVVPYLIATLVLNRNFKHLMVCIFLGLTTVFFYTPIFGSEDISEIGYSWTLRLEEIFAGQWSLEKLNKISGRATIRDSAYMLFLNSPFIGHGTSSFELLGPGYREAHSLFYTVLAEKGIIGFVLTYACLIYLGRHLIVQASRIRDAWLLVCGFFTYLIFNHTVGSVFFILPRKSLTVSCIAPIILACYYFYPQCICSQDAPILRRQS